MHELSIAQSIVDIVADHVPRPRLDRVRSIRVRVGAMSGVVPDSLEFCFTAITAESELAGARIDIVPVPFLLRCDPCARDFTSDSGSPRCSVCGLPGQVLSGTELQVMEIELLETGTDEP